MERTDRFDGRPLTGEFCNTNSILPRDSKVFTEKISHRSYGMNLVSQELHRRGLVVRHKLTGKIKSPRTGLGLFQSENAYTMRF